MMTDPLADMLTRLRNAVRVERAVVDVPASSVKIGVAEALKAEGFIYEYQLGYHATGPDGQKNFEPSEDAAKPQRQLRLFLKYGPQGEKVIRRVERVSKPGCRVYRGYRDLRPVLDGLGVSLLSTSKGVMSDRQARQAKLGGEVLCRVW